MLSVYLVAEDGPSAPEVFRLICNITRANIAASQTTGLDHDGFAFDSEPDVSMACLSGAQRSSTSLPNLDHHPWRDYPSSKIGVGCED